MKGKEQADWSHITLPVEAATCMGRISIFVVLELTVKMRIGWGEELGNLYSGERLCKLSSHKTFREKLHYDCMQKLCCSYDSHKIIFRYVLYGNDSAQNIICMLC